jgi:hypothetical protein
MGVDFDIVSADGETFLAREVVEMARRGARFRRALTVSAHPGHGRQEDRRVLSDALPCGRLGAVRFRMVG